MAEQAASESSPDTDRDFDPSAEMLIHDYDDEQTLDEEEAMSNGESVMNELVALQQESEMPMEELLAMYGYGRESNEPKEVGTSNVATNETNINSEEETIGPTAQPMETDGGGGHTESVDNSDPDKSNSEQESVVPSQMAILLTADPMEASTDEDEEDDEDYEPDNEENWKKSVQVGSDYQAVVPEGQESYGDAPVYEGEDRLLWDPKTLTDSDIEKYLEQVQTHNFSTAQGVHAIPAGSHIRDDEQALYLLLNCELNLDEALRRHKLQSVPTSDPMSLWSEEECRNFELGLRTYGKDFFANQQNKVRTRSVKELVQFYYLWKKTERHDAFAARTRLEKKKYALHPGITDYMDRFLDEHESLSGEPHDQMTSPNIRSLLYGDPKRQQEGRSSEDFTAALEIVQKVANSATVDFLLPEKFREDMQTVVLGSIGTHAEPVPELDRYGCGEEVPFAPPIVAPLQPQLNMLYGVPVPDNAQARHPILMGPDVGLPSNETSDCLDRVLELDRNSGLPPPKRPRLQLPLPTELLQLGGTQGNHFAAKEAVPSGIPVTSACLSPAAPDSASLTSSTVSSSSTSLLLGSAFLSASGGISESNSGRIRLPNDDGDGAMAGLVAGVVSTGPGLFSTSGSAISTSLPPSAFDSFPTTAGTLVMAVEPNPDAGVVSPLDDALTIDDSMNPSFQRLTSLDSIEPSLPALETSIDTYTSVLSGPSGIALESMTLDSLTSMLDGFNPNAAAASGCAPPSLVDDSSSGPVSAADSALTQSDCSVPLTTAAPAIGDLGEKSLTESVAAETAATDKGLGCSVGSGRASTAVVHSVASDTTGTMKFERCQPPFTKNVLPDGSRPVDTCVDPPLDGGKVSDNVEGAVAETTFTAATHKDICASSEQVPDDATADRSVTSQGPNLVIDVPGSDAELTPETKPTLDGELGPRLRPVQDAGAAIDNLNNEVDCLSGNQLNSVDAAVCEALVTEHSTSALST